MNTIDGGLVGRPAEMRSDAELRRTLADHRATDTGTCTGCDYVASKGQPRCPDAVGALREMSATRTRPSLRTLSDDQLLTRAAQHSVALGRCSRCGFRASAGLVCPTLRTIRCELEVRGLMPFTSSTPNGGVCAGKPEAWELAGSELAALRRAQEACFSCPLLASCAADLREAISRGAQPRSAIQAARVFNEDGIEVGDLRQHWMLIQGGNRAPIRRGQAHAQGVAA